MLLFRRDPNLFLYPLIQSWPTPSQSSETAILRVEKDSVLFLNELRFKKISALKLKIPLTDTEVPAVQAALGRIGIFEGKDYRGIEVLSDIRVIPEINWIMLSKVDKSEIFSPLRISAYIIIGFTAFLIIICGTGLAFIYKSRQKNIVMELYNKEKELWLQEERFKVTIDSLADGVITTDINGNIIYLNNRAEELTGWNNREARGRALSEVYYVRNEETGQIETNILEKVIKHGIVKELANHTILLSKTGKEIAVMDTGAPIFDVDGSTTGIVVTFQDETEKRKQQKLIKESENRLRSTLNNMMEGCQIIDFDWRFVFINKTAEQQNRRPIEELLGKIYMDMWPGIEDTEVFRMIKKCMESRISCVMDNEFTFPDGTIGWFELSVEPVPEGILILSDDITEKKRAAINLQIEHDRALQYFDTAQVIMLILDINGNISQINKKGIEVLGYSKDELIGKNWFDDFLPNNNIDEVKEVFKQIIAGEIETIEFLRKYSYS
ncbi:MAG: PAS domain S-box protein [Candidatus Kapabacteria bacterium]|nr:PAS domain S-box protein [Candidatus Kapabacteria bacterium]